MSRAETNLIVFFCCLCAFVFAQDNRTISGFGNNPNDLELGAAGSKITNYCSNGYLDLISQPPGEDRGNPRDISNILFDQIGGINDQIGHSDFVWAFGQFIDHDITFVIDFSPFEHPEEAMMIPVPFNDQYFLPNTVIPMMRSLAVEGSGTSVDNPRTFANQITSFVDASTIYGSDEHTALWLRSFVDGKLKVSTGNLLPWNTTDGEFNSIIDKTAPEVDNPVHLSEKLYISGDKRVNENPLLTTFHTLFVREHNRICDELIENHPDWDDEQLYQYARKMVGAIVQNILYYEWLPSIGIQLPAYNAYNPNIDPSIINVFSAAAFRMGHTLINSNLIRMTNEGEEAPTGHIRLKDAFFNPLTINLAGGIEPYIKGMATQVQQDFDCKVISDLRNFLFGNPQAGGLDLAAININRGRDRGLPDYNTIRENFGLPKVSKFSDICIDPQVNIILQEIYQTVDNVDPWVGMLAEDHLDGSMFGELVTQILAYQFRNLRDGDRFYFENDDAIAEEDLEFIKNTKMVDVIMRNTNIDLMQAKVFLAKPHTDLVDGPTVEHINLTTNVYPNPVQNNTVHYIAWSEIKQDVNVQVLDLTGNVIFNEVLSYKDGKNFIDIDLPEQAQPGIYHLKSIAGRQYYINKILVE